MARLRAAIFYLILTISVLDVVQSASITKVNSLDLPGGEKITKREAPNEPPQTATIHDIPKELQKTDDQEKGTKLSKPVPSLEDKDDSKSSEDDSHHIYKVKEPRQRRAAPPKAEDVEDLDTAANTVFLPHFRKHFRPANRFRREVNDMVIEDIADEGKGHGRYVREAQDQGDLDTAANTVFLPQFRKRFRPNFRQV